MDTLFCFLTSLAFGGVMSRTGSIVMLIGFRDSIVVARFMGAPLDRRSVSVVIPCHVSVLTC